MSGRFEQARGTVAADSDAWEHVAEEVSRLVRMKHEMSGAWPRLLLDLVDAMEAAARAAPTRPVSGPKGAPGRPATVGESTREVAARMGCSEQWVRELIRSGRLPAQRVGRTWVIDPGASDRRRPRRSA